MVWCTIALPLHAQTNPYKISDKLYPIYVRAHQARRTQQGLRTADTLYNKALALNDKKAQCLALTIPFLYHYYKEDRPALEKALKNLQDKALQTGYIQYYYYGANNKVNYIMNQGNWSEALHYTNQFPDYAKKNKHNYGIYTGYRCLGQIQLQRHATRQAVQAYLQALDYGQRHLPDQDLAAIYRHISDCYLATENYGEALDYTEKGLKISKSQQTHNTLLVNKCRALFLLGRKDEFLKNYEQALKGYGQVNSNQAKDAKSISLFHELRFFKMLIDGNYTEAEKILENISPLAQQMKLRAVYYNRIGDFKQAQECLRKQYYLYKEMTEKVSEDALNEMNARLNNQRLENEKQQTDLQNTQLELANTQLTLKNSSLELGQAKAAEHLARLNADNYKLSFDNKKLEARQLHDSLAAQKAKREAQEKDMKTRNMLLRILLIVAVIIITLTFIYVYNVRRIAKKLKHSNHHLRQTISELFIAKDKAQQADQMKTMFIQNMSHEIRTPLNAIVGFSQVLVEMGNDLGEEDKKEMSDSIMTNSELLTTLINDILDITSLESGKYVMMMEPANVNKLCREALDTVKHRKAQGVDLLMDSEVGEDYTVNTDALRVKQVLINLLTNAEKNTNHGSITLTCSLQENPGMLTFSVADTGIGVPKEKMAEIFERFKKLDRYKQGSGLGLSICQMIAERLGGRIYIDENYTGGARFLFTIQISDKQRRPTK